MNILRGFQLFTTFTVLQYCRTDILINEVNSDNPSSDSAEFVELWNPDHCRRSLDGYVLVFINAFYNPAPVYTTVNLSGHFVEGREYFLIGSPQVIPIPDITPFTDNGIQNGLGKTDAIAVYNNFYVPTVATRTNLVDAVVYDKGTVTSTASIFPALMDYQTVVIEDESLLSGDESISRCNKAPLDLLSFSVGELTPGRDNFCFVNSFEPLLNSDSLLRIYSDKFTKVKQSKIVGQAFFTIQVDTLMECAKVCSRHDTCARFMYSEDVLTEHNCGLHHSHQRTLITDSNWTVGVKLCA